MEISHLIVFIIYLLSLLSMLTLILLLITGARAASKRFVLFISSLFIWFLPQFLAQFVFFSSPSAYNALVRTSLLVAGFVIPSLTLFVRERVKNHKLKLMNIISILSLGLGFLNFTPFSPLSVKVSTSGIAITSSRPFYSLHTVTVFAGFIVAIFAIRSYQKVNKDLETQQALYTLRKALGFTIALNIFAALFLAKYEWSQVFTPVSMAVLTGIMYIAIFKHRLYDVRKLVARSLAYVSTVLVLSLLYGWVAFGIVARLIFNDRSATVAQEVFQAFLVMGAAYTLQPLRRLFNRLSNKIFYRDSYDSAAFLSEFNRLLVSTIDLKKLLVGTSAIIKSNLKTHKCEFYISETEYAGRRIISDINTVTDEARAEEIKAALRSKRKRIFVAESMPVGNPLKKLLIENDIAVVIKLETKNQKNNTDIDLLILGSKESGSIYSSEDISLLLLLSSELIIGIQNSMRFEEIQQFNDTLQQKITEATKELRKTNDKLKALDEAKDEFISMASHQLRTPLTSVKGYVSMVLDGDAGKITADQRDLLEQAYGSSQRMVYLIADLLNVSRLRTGKFIIQNAPCQLADVIEGEVSQLKEAAKIHDLELTYEKPADFPLLNVDEMKLRQVIMNFMDNAIYYTPSGGHIKVVLSATDKVIEYKVIDDGLGVPKSEQHHLFTKFYRAGNARKARPDGTGLGLFMAKKVIVAQGGSIIFESEEGKGSTFGFSFPRSAVALKN